jgi:hypothetical protein
VEALAADLRYAFGVPYSVVGILPSSFHSDPSADVWIPMQADPNSAN